MNGAKVFSPDVKVFLESHDPAYERLSVCSGNVKADTVDDLHNGHKYAAQSYKPSADWRPLTTAEMMQVLSLRPDLDYKRNIGLFSLPAGLKALLSELGLGKLDSLAAAKQRIVEKKELFGRVNVALNRFIGKFSMPGSLVTPYIHGIFYNQPGLETIGVSDKGYIGMHIDNGHAFKVDQLSAAPNRMCINLGQEDRHLLFIPRTSGEILRSLQTTMDIDTARYKEYQLTRDFLSANLACPVLKLKQKPYEAYIAPTDNIIHDGCTVGMKEMDVSLVLIGEFGAWQTQPAPR